MSPEQERLLIQLSEDVKEIKTGMLGNDYVKGAIPRLNVLEQRVNNHERESEAKKNRNKGIMIIMTAAWTGFVLFLTEALRYFRDNP